MSKDKVEKKNRQVKLVFGEVGEPGIRLQPSDFNSLKIISFHDPWAVRLPNGRYRMYVAANVDAGAGAHKSVIVSATTPEK